MQATRQILWILMIALAGAMAAVWIGLPVPLITGPALLSTGLSLAGWRRTFPVTFRNFVFLVAGVAIGAGVTRESLTAFATWPLAYLLLALAIPAVVLVSQAFLRMGAGLDRVSALLASVPGHLSFVIALSEESGAEIRAVIVIQAVRLLSLTLLVPVIAAGFGLDTSAGSSLTTGSPGEMSLVITALAIGAALAVFPLMRANGAPAPILMAGLAVGATLRLSGLAEGPMSHWLFYPAMAAIGALIGTQFSGITPAELRKYGIAGIGVTLIGAGIMLAAAMLVSAVLDFDVLHVLVAFAPGALETMNIMGALLGANAGFVAAAHVGRMLMLSFLVPVMLVRARRF